MAFIELYMRLNGSIPKIPIDLCQHLVNDAWRDVRRQSMWSFQLFDACWTSPGIITVGSFQATLGSNEIFLDANASTAVQAQLLGPPTPITQRQFRYGVGTIYNIWGVTQVPQTGWNQGGFNQGGLDNSLITLTLDRPYAEASTNGFTSGYEIFQNYYPVPMSDFWYFQSVKNMTNYQTLGLDWTQADLNYKDPQRTWYQWPTQVVSYQPDQNKNSPTYRWPMYELWGVPQYLLSYQLIGVRHGLPLVEDDDEIDLAVGEDCVLALARVYGYEWAEANKGDNPRDTGPDYRFLTGLARKEYEILYKSYRKADRQIYDNFFIQRRMPSWSSHLGPYYNSIGGTASPGGW